MGFDICNTAVSFAVRTAVSFAARTAVSFAARIAVNIAVSFPISTVEYIIVTLRVYPIVIRLAKERTKGPSRCPAERTKGTSRCPLIPSSVLFLLVNQALYSFAGVFNGDAVVVDAVVHHMLAA